MMTTSSQMAAEEWVTFPGGELEGRRPKALCPACRTRLRQAAAGGAPHHRIVAPPHQPLCFNCYRAELKSEQALHAARELDPGSVELFQGALPLEPVDRPRLDMLKV